MNGKVRSEFLVNYLIRIEMWVLHVSFSAGYLIYRLPHQRQQRSPRAPQRVC